jgi:transcriptional regulator with XRE-family HTH domain
MFINKAENGKNNLCGEKVALLRKEMGISQRVLAERLQIRGIDIDKNAVQRIECGKRFVTDIELKIIAELFSVTMDDLVK